MTNPPKNCEITFREPFPRVVNMKLHIRAIIDETPEREIKIETEQQSDILAYLIRVDKKLTNAIVRADSMGRWAVLQHSPALDFFDLVDRGESNEILRSVEV